MTLNEKERKKILEIYQKYHRAKELSNIKTQLDYLKTAQQFLRYIKPFLDFVALEDESLKKLKNAFDEEDLKELHGKMNELETSTSYGRMKLEESISKIIQKNLSNFQEIESLIFWILSSDNKKTESGDLKELKFEKKEK